MSMSPQCIPLQSVDGVTISILADNLFDGLLPDHGPAKRPQFGLQIPRIPAQQYYSDAFPTYETLVYYLGQHAVAPGKSQTYSVEADNAELRHCLASLGHRSRCFSRSIDALRPAVKLFVHA